ncbi:ImmA/IrrE family metallo-endopeptidase [Anaerolactibacter massiliensis]|uniref:ImmA/IrrE family metallo-endopeptidase n=1 Tax=Anaerolactibacter massiliensis TaxID=2044573 RepID=UPI000CFA2A4E|nr:ImmA/IrrE family metallo-endopeptidase [Anaerolactibacter massiliensis]
MAEALSGVNGEIIRWAREFYNMSPDEAAQAIGVDISRYLNWENGTEHPTYAKLKKISDVFRKPSAVFFFPEPPQLPSIKGDLRTLPDEIVNSFSKNVIIQFEKAKVYQLSLDELYGNKESIIAQRSSFPNDIDQLCNFFRMQLEFPISAQKARKSTKVVFEIFREKFYDLGIYVFKDAFKDNRISGICLNDDHFPVIVINNSMSFARQIFTLFHELYHLISDTSGAEIIRDDYYVALNNQQTEIEKACDTFANAFLVPMDDFKLELTKRPINEDRIEELATLYSVSKEAIMYKLYKMGMMTSAEYNDLKEFFYGDAIRNGDKKKGQGRGGNHYYTQLTYLGQRYAGDVFKQYFSGKIDSVRASEMLQSKVDHLPNLETVYFRGVSR